MHVFAVLESGLADVVGGLGGGGAIAVPVAGRRLVAVAMSSMELWRPGSDLVRQFGGAHRVDLLLACDDDRSDDPGPDCGPGYADYPDDEEDSDGGSVVELADATDESRTAAARFGSHVRLHRLGLRAPLGSHADDDLVGALSELIGFDPEPSVYCLAPAQAPSNPSQVVLDRAVRRIALVYGIPLLRYRCLEFFVVGEGSPCTCN